MSVATEQLKKTETTRPWWRFGTTGWVLIGGLILLNAGFLFGGLDWDKRTIGWLIYRVDPRYWPLWPVPILWGIVAWMLNDSLKDRITWITKKQRWIKSGIVVVVLCWTAWFAGWTLMSLRRRIYYQLYVAYIMGPIALYIADGTTSWKLLISPTLAIVAIASLLYVAYSQRRKRHESTACIEKSSEADE